MTRRLLLGTLTGLATLVAVALLGVAVVTGATSASAHWTVLGTGTATGSAATLATPAAPTATATSSSAVTVSGSLPTNPTGTSYVVRRGTTTVCSPTATPYSCNDTGLTASTSYGYSVVATVGAWTATSATTSVTTACTGPDTLQLVAAADTLVAGTSTSVTVIALTCAGVTDTAFSGTVTWSGLASSPTGSAPAYGALTLSGGTGTTTVTPKAAGAATLTATVGGLSASDTFTVTAGSPASLAWIDPQNNAGAVSLSCPAPSASRSCSQTSARSGSLFTAATWSAQVGLVDTLGNASPATADTTVTVTVGSASGTATIAKGATSSSRVGYTYPFLTYSLTWTARTTSPALTATVTGAG